MARILHHSLDRQIDPRWQKVTNLIDAAFDLRFLGIDVLPPLEKHVDGAVAPAGTAFYHGYPIYFLDRTFERFGDGNHHPVDGLLAVVGDDGHARKEHLGKQVGLHPGVGKNTGDEQ